MKKIGFILSVVFCLSLVLTSCSLGEPDEFEGIWVDKRNAENVWEIKKEGDVFIGKRLSGEDTYDFDEESWKKSKEGKFQDPNKGIPILTPLKEGGTKFTYLKAQDAILRLPPGRTYIRKK